MPDPPTAEHVSVTGLPAVTGFGLAVAVVTGMFTALIVK